MQVTFTGYQRCAKNVKAITSTKRVSISLLKKCSWNVYDLLQTKQRFHTFTHIFKPLMIHTY